MAEPTTFEDLHAAQRIANALIPEHHKGLSNTRIRYVLSGEKPGKKGCKKFAKIELVSEHHRWLIASEIAEEQGDPSDADGYGVPDVIIWFPLLAWLVLDASQQRALVDHMLSHIFVTEDGEYALVGHDVSEFIAIRERHGAWLPEIKRFVGGQQLPMDLGGRTAPRTREDAADLAAAALNGAFAARGVDAVADRGEFAEVGG